jgi:hypothetical protein
MARCKLANVTGKGAPPILIVWADEGERGFDCLYLSPAKARAILECIDDIRTFADDRIRHYLERP